MTTSTYKIKSHKSKKRSKSVSKKNNNMRGGSIVTIDGRTLEQVIRDEYEKLRIHREESVIRFDRNKKLNLPAATKQKEQDENTYFLNELYINDIRRNGDIEAVDRLIKLRREIQDLRNTIDKEKDTNKLQELYLSVDWHTKQIQDLMKFGSSGTYSKNFFERVDWMRKNKENNEKTYSAILDNIREKR
jgi:hypothetical protein